MKKSWFITTGTLALAGAMAGLGAFGGMAFASTPASSATPTAIVQPATPVAAPIIQVKPDSEKPSLEESTASSKETDNVNYEEQGDHQGNNGVAEAGAGVAEKRLRFAIQSKWGNLNPIPSSPHLRHIFSTSETNNTRKYGYKNNGKDYNRKIILYNRQIPKEVSSEDNRNNPS